MRPPARRRATRTESNAFVGPGSEPPELESGCQRHGDRDVTVAAHRHDSVWHTGRLSSEHSLAGSLAAPGGRAGAGARAGPVRFSDSIESDSEPPGPGATGTPGHRDWH